MFRLLIDLSNTMENAFAFIIPSASIEIDFRKFTFLRIIRNGIVERMMTRAPDGYKHAIRVRMLTQLCHHGNGISGIPRYRIAMHRISTKEINMTVFLQQFIVLSESAAGQHDSLTVNLHLTAFIGCHNTFNSALFIQK